jgi:hypothetical protein
MTYNIRQQLKHYQDTHTKHSIRKAKLHATSKHLKVWSITGMATHGDVAPVDLNIVMLHCMLRAFRFLLVFALFIFIFTLYVLISVLIVNCLVLRCCRLRTDRVRQLIPGCNSSIPYWMETKNCCSYLKNFYCLLKTNNTIEISRWPFLKFV